MAERMTLSIQELAEALGVSYPLALELSHRADFPVIVVGRRRLIPRDALAAWLARQAEEANRT